MKSKKVLLRPKYQKIFDRIGENISLIEYVLVFLHTGLILIQHARLILTRTICS